MGLFSTLRDAIVSKITHRKTTTQPGKGPASVPTTGSAQLPADKNVNFPPATSPLPPEPQRLTADELASQLDMMETDHPEDLKWRTSIVDLMKLVGMDSSYAERKEMALDLGYSQSDIDSKGSAEMNMWLHKKVMEKLSEDTDGDLNIA